MSDGIQIDFLVEPREAVTFGSPKSFSAGEAHRVSSIFPPSPRTFQGMVRSQLLRGASPPMDLDDWSRAARDERATLVGGPHTLPFGWQLTGPLPAQARPDTSDRDKSVIQPWVPAPRYLLRDGSRILRTRPVISTHQVLSDRGVLPIVLGRPDLPDAEPESAWLSPEGLWFALTGQGGVMPVNEHYRKHLPPFVVNEPRSGLAIERSSDHPAQGTARHGMLYFMDAWRFRPGTGLWGSLRAQLAPRLRRDALLDEGGMAGRKGRLIRFQAVDQFEKVWQDILDGKHIPMDIGENERFWLMTLTPVFIQTPESPKIRGAKSGEVSIEVLAALTDRPLTLGGFDMTRARPRPNRAYVPAGSAWLIEIRGGTSAQRRQHLLALHNAHPLGPAEEAVMGFGHTLVGLGPLPSEDLL